MPDTSLKIDRYVLAAAVVLTCVLFTSKAADPVNVIKLTALLLCALAVVSTATYRAIRHRIVVLPHAWTAWAALALLVALLVSAVAAPVTTQAVLGTYGRNSGLLAYGSAVALFLVGLRALQPPHTRVLVGGVVAAGLFTSTYGLLQRLGVDAIPWNNPFNPIIAALGNPNFASAYMGVAAAVAAGAALWTGWSRGLRAASAVTAALCLGVAAVSNSVQGPIAAASGLTVVAVAVALGLQPKARRLSLTALGTGALLGVGTLAVGAVTRSGPVGAVFADYGSQARTYYWDAALQMFQGRPVLGVGLDHYGSFWRSSRSPESVAFLGGTGFSDAAHSVPLQMLAQGGLLLGLCYLAFVLLVGAALVRGLLRLAGPDRILLAAVGGGWAAYQVQSLVSIDQVPLIVLHLILASGVVAVSGSVRLREVRLPGALKPVAVHPNDSRARRRTAAAQAARLREVTGADLAGMAVVGGLVLWGAWLALVPLRANVAVAAGDRALARGEGNAALDHYRAATGLVPGQATYWGKQASLLEQFKQVAAAKRALDEAAERDPYDVSALRNAARAAEAASDLDRARELYNRAVEVDPSGPVTLVAASTFELRHSGAERARALLEEAVTQVPEQAALWATLGDARAALGDSEGAKEAYGRALQIEPGQATATAGLAKLAAAG